MLSIYCGIKFDLNIIKDIYVNKILVDDIVFIYGDLFFMQGGMPMLLEDLDTLHL